MEISGGESQLSNIFPNLHSEPQIELAVHRAHAQNIEYPKTKLQRISVYLDRLEEIDNVNDIDKREKAVSFIKSIVHKAVVISPSNVPDSYFNTQKRLARERGHGNIEISEDLKVKMSENIIKDQAKSIDRWVDYFADSKLYPTWFKYLCIRGISGLGVYDKKQKKYSIRRNDTIAPFPELNEEVVGNLYRIVSQMGKRQVSFAKLMEEATIASERTKSLENSIDGDWVLYPKGGNHIALSESLVGYGTGWCSVYEETAKIQLQFGDFYVYYSKDQSGRKSIPRIAIRTEDGYVEEVRGILPGQEIEPDFLDKAREQYSKLPGGDKYEKKDGDMKRMTKIEKAIKKDESISTVDIEFLWELDGDIEGFGKYRDPRIAELRSLRSVVRDMSLVEITDSNTEKIISHLISALNGNTLSAEEVSKALTMITQDNSGRNANLLLDPLINLARTKKMDINPYVDYLLQGFHSEISELIITNTQDLNAALDEYVLKNKKNQYILVNMFHWLSEENVSKILEFFDYVGFFPSQELGNRLRSGAYSEGKTKLFLEFGVDPDQLGLALHEGKIVGVGNIAKAKEIVDIPNKGTRTPWEKPVYPNFYHKFDRLMSIYRRNSEDVTKRPRWYSEVELSDDDI
jgi:hypothetical protein